MLKPYLTFKKLKVGGLRTFRGFSIVRRLGGSIMQCGQQSKLVQSCSCVCWNFIVAHFVQTCSRAFMLFGSCRSKVSRNCCNILWSRPDMLQTYSAHFCVIDSSVILVSLERFSKVFTTAVRWVAFAGCASQDHDWHTGRFGMTGLSRESSGSWIETSSEAVLPAF